MEVKQYIDATGQRKEVGKSRTQQRCRARTVGHRVSRCLLSPALSGHQAYQSLACILDSSSMAGSVTLIDFCI